MVEEHSIAIENNLDDFPRVSQMLEELSEQWGLDMKIAMNLSLCLEEALTNVIFYAYPGGENGSVEVVFRKEPSVVHIEIEDEGVEFNPLTDSKEPDLESTIEDRPIGGLGIHFVKQFMDEIQYQRINNKNQLVFSKSI